MDEDKLTPSGEDYRRVPQERAWWRPEAESGSAMAGAELRFDMTFADFRRLQAHMGRRVHRRNRGAYTVALMGVVLCALFLAFAILVNLNPGIAYRLFGDWGYPTAIYVAIVGCLVAAILALLPAVKLRMRTLRLQVSDDGPFLGPTRIAIEPDGLLVERPTLRAKYAWAAFRGVETSGRAIVLPIDEGIGLIIPASAFPSEEFVKEIQRQVNPNALDSGVG